MSLKKKRLKRTAKKITLRVHSQELVYLETFANMNTSEAIRDCIEFRRRFDDKFTNHKQWLKILDDRTMAALVTFMNHMAAQHTKYYTEKIEELEKLITKEKK